MSGISFAKSDVAAVIGLADLYGCFPVDLGPGLWGGLRRTPIAARVRWCTGARYADPIFALRSCSTDLWPEFLGPIHEVLTP